MGKFGAPNCLRRIKIYASWKPHQYQRSKSW